MPIYEKATWQLMKDCVQEMKKEIFIVHDIQSWFRAKYPQIKQNTVYLHVRKMTTNLRARLNWDIKPERDDLFYQLPNGSLRLYNAESDPTPIYNNNKPSIQESPEQENPIAENPGVEEERVEHAFAFENDLKNFLVKHLFLVENGLRLYEQDGVRGVEFPVDGRYIDILAVDDTNNLVVIELKVSKGYEKVIGQLLRYKNWVAKNIANNGQKVRGIIIAKDITEDLKFATDGLPDIELYEYDLAITLRKI